MTAAASTQPDLFTYAERVELEARAVLARRPSRARPSNPHTSHLAARVNGVRAGTQRARVLLELERRGDATAYELGQALGILRTAAGTRLGELAGAGPIVRPALVELTGEQRPTDTGVDAQAYRLTELGRDVATELRRLAAQ